MDEKEKENMKKECRYLILLSCEPGQPRAEPAKHPPSRPLALQLLDPLLDDLGRPIKLGLMPRETHPIVNRVWELVVFHVRHLVRRILGRRAARVPESETANFVEKGFAAAVFVSRAAGGRGEREKGEGQRKE